MINNIIKALDSMKLETGWQTKGEYSFSNVIWDDPLLAPSEDDFNEALSLIEANIYRENRALEYPPIGDQLDALFHAGLFPEEMASKIQEVKDRYPK